MPSPEPKHYFKWDDMHVLVHRLCSDMKHASYHPLCILSIGRGGMIPGAMLAYKYGLETNNYIEHQVVYAWSYMQDGTCKVPGGIKIDWPPAALLDSYRGMERKLLIIDDLVDTGETMLAFKKAFPLAATAALMHKEVAEVDVDFCPLRWNDAPWIVFPWEVQ